MPIGDFSHWGSLSLRKVMGLLEPGFISEGIRQYTNALMIVFVPKETVVATGAIL